MSDGIPLLAPGLVRVGPGQSGDVGVLDSGWMVAFRNEEWHVAWPPDGTTGVLVHLVAELRNPVPAEHQARFGYPITLQFVVRLSGNEFEATLHLREGAGAGKDVPCWFSSPEQTTNPELASANSLCLIPWAPLRAGAIYTVTAELVREKKTVTWSFST